MKGKYARLARAVLTSGIALVVNCLINLLLTPYVTSAVGITAYGFIALSKNFTQYASILTEALNSFSGRYVALAHHEGRKDEAQVYFSSTFFGNAVISVLVAVVSVLFAVFADEILNVPAELLSDVRILMLLTALAFIITALFTVYGIPAIIADRLDAAGIFKSLAYLTEGLILIVCYGLFRARAYYVGISVAAAATVIAVGNCYLSVKFVPYLKVRKSMFRGSAVRTLLRDGVWTSMNSLGVTLNNGLDLLVCNLMLTPADMGRLAAAKTFNSLFAGLFVVIGTAFHPMFLKSWASGDRGTLKKDLIMSMKVSGFASNLVFAGFFAYGLVFCRLWLPSEDPALIYSLTVVSNLAVVPSGPMHPLYYIYVLALKRKLPALVTIAGGILNVAGMYLLIRYAGMGAHAVVWTTAVVMMVVNFITNPLYMAHVLDFPLSTFYPGIIRNVASCGAMCLIFSGMARIFAPTGWVGLILAAMTCAAVGLPVHFMIACGSDERRAIISKVVNKCRAKNNS